MMQRLNLTRCQCPEPGFCQRHKMSKSRFLWLACQRDDGLFHFWEQQALNHTSETTTGPPRPLPRCRHRGLDVVEMVRCESCGNRGVLVPVHACALHGRCTERRFGNSTDASRSTHACTACSEYVPVSVDGDSR